jgi:hypothetical protein
VLCKGVGATRLTSFHHAPRRDLARLKRDIADTITASNEAHAAKEKALSEIQSLKLQAEREHATFEEEFRQLTQIIEDDRRWVGLCVCRVV